MIPKYINKWLNIIEKMNNDNTYKLAWGRAIIECVALDHYKIEDNKVIISFTDISEKILKYYWNQSFFFKLKQSPYVDKIPQIQQSTEKLIEIYKKESNSIIPIWFDECKIFFEKHNISYYQKTINEVTKVLPRDVAYRFLNTNNGVEKVYDYNKGEHHIIINQEDVKDLKDYSVLISQLLNYKWTQLLEKYNFAPKIASKVKGISDNKIRRASLANYRNILLQQFKDGKIIDFYTGQELDEKDISIDHVIPWSYIYSDDIWNLVITSSSYNSSKSNSIPEEEFITKLEERNKQLLDIIDEPKYKRQIENAIKNNTVRKIFYDCRL